MYKHFAEIAEVGKFHELGEADVFVLPMDVVDLENHENRVIKILQHFGKVQPEERRHSPPAFAKSPHFQISVVFLNAGRSQRACWERISASVDRELLEVNAVAAANLARKVLPYFLAQGGGTFAVVSGLYGKAGVPYMGSCCAAKFALHVSVR